MYEIPTRFDTVSAVWSLGDKCMGRELVHCNLTKIIASISIRSDTPLLCAIPSQGLDSGLNVPTHVTGTWNQ